MSAPVIHLATVRLNRAAEAAAKADRKADEARPAKRLAMGTWNTSARMVGWHANLMTDAELVWFFGIVRKNPDDALRLKSLASALLTRASEEDGRRRELERQRLCARLRLLGVDPARVAL